MTVTVLSLSRPVTEKFADVSWISIKTRQNRGSKGVISLEGSVSFIDIRMAYSLPVWLD